MRAPYLIAAVIVCAALAAAVPDAAHAQAEPQFFMLTDRGNVFPVIGPPPDRPPGFDSAPHLDSHQIDTAYALSADSTPTSPGVYEFGQAGAFLTLPDHDPARPSMTAMLVTDWGTASGGLYAPFPVGELRVYNGQADKPYLGPGRAAPGSLDILALCNGSHSGVSCVDNRQGVDLTPRSTANNGHVLTLPSTGRSIVHLSNITSVGDHMEIFFTCPGCRTHSKAYWGVESFEWTGTFWERGWEHPTTTLFNGDTPPTTPVRIDPGVLYRLAWGSVTDPRGITFWEDGGLCSRTPTIIISGTYQILDNVCDPGSVFEVGSARTDQWKPLVPGWNSVNASANSFIIVADPGDGARLQVRNGTYECCTGFDDGVVNLARNAAGDPKAAVIHNEDRHLLIIPYGKHVPKGHGALEEMHHIRWSMREEVRTDTRWLAHDGPGDSVYHGLWYGHGLWPPYQVRLVDVEGTSFKQPDLQDSILDYLDWSDYSQDDLREIVQMRPPGGLMDSDVYDVRNDKWLRSDKGRFILWDGTHVELEYIHPWMRMEKSPVWETFGVGLQRDALTIVERYVTIPVVQPTRMSETYLSSIPCGQPGDEEMNRLWEALVEAQQLGGYDQHLLNFLITTSHDDSIDKNNRLQQIYLASRTYLDYVDGAYLAGDRIHVPVLPNRPYLCTIIAPNVLESQYMVYGLPFGDTYVSLGGTEGTAFTTNLHDGLGTAYERTMAVQSPRDGVVSLDVTARFGAAVSAVAVGNYSGNFPGGSTGQWMNGTVRVNATLFVGDVNPEEDEGILLTEFDVDLYDTGHALWWTGGKCYYRFTSTPDDSEYVVSTVTAAAELGEHIPITLVMEAHGQPLVPRGPFTYTHGLTMYIFDGGISSRVISVPEEGVAGNLTLTLTLNPHNIADARRSLNWTPPGGLGTAGGTDVVLESPSGTVHTMEPVRSTDTTLSTLTYDANAFAGEEMHGTWTLYVVDHGSGPGTDPLNPFTNWYHTHSSDFRISSWDLEIKRASGLEVGELCDETLSESAVVQYILRTFAIDVR